MFSCETNRLYYQDFYVFLRKFILTKVEECVYNTHYDRTFHISAQNDANAYRQCTSQMESAQKQHLLFDRIVCKKHFSKSKAHLKQEQEFITIDRMPATRA